MKSIKVVYFPVPNLGDVLSPFIVHNLSGLKVCPRDSYGQKRQLLRCVARFIAFPLLGRFAKWKRVQMPYDRPILAVGSILSWGNPHSVVWGAGFMSENERFHGGTIYAVRGGQSYTLLTQQGYTGPKPVFGDPALLMPLLIAPAEERGTVGIIPHWWETDFFLKTYGDRLRIIDLRTNDVEACIRQITSCRLILSTSLHGIIIPHAYGIPALHIKHGPMNEFKFFDYFSSVGIGPYEGFTNVDQLLSLNEQGLEDFFAANKERALPQKSIEQIRASLLRVAPFPLLNKYKAFAR